MPLSTSSFRRPIPTAHWSAVWAVTGALIVVFLVAWEMYWRSKGYVGGYSDSQDLWAIQRERVGEGDGKQTVFVGASRTRFDIDLDTWERERGRRPVQLAMNGAAGYPFLADLATDERFSGTVICGVTEGLFFLPEFTGLAQRAIKLVRYAQRRGPSEAVSYWLLQKLETRLAMLNGWDLSLSALINSRFRMEDREGAVVIPPEPPLFATLTADRQANMWDRVREDSELGRRIQQIWLPLFGFGPPPGGPPLEAVMGSVVRSVKAIEARGGRVIFVRFPSTQALRELEEARTPRSVLWQRLLAETGAPGIHFEDYPELSVYPCPEWSHLSAEDTPNFTRDLISVMERDGVLE